jgi:WD40 repeat protein
MWELNNGTCKKTVLDSAQGVITSLDISPDGKMLAFSNESGIVKCLGLGKPSTGPVRLPASKSPVISIVFSNNGKSIAM